MTTLNLANINKSNVNYIISSFPDGQQDILIKDYTNSTQTVTIISRFNNFRDLELIICATKALRRLHVENINLNIPYLLGARSDRKFQQGGTSYLVDVIAPIINSLGFTQVTCIDAHSDVAEAVINRLTSIPSSSYVRDMLFLMGDERPKNYYIVSPDAGALKKIYNVAKSLYYNKEILVASKHRDVITGAITHTEVPITSEIIFSGNDFVIFDDICDGGRTFIEIAKVIKAEQERHNQLKSERGKIILVVTHGIFSAGFKELSEYINVIVTTNSVKNIASVLINPKDDRPYKLYQLEVL